MFQHFLTTKAGVSVCVCVRYGAGGHHGLYSPKSYQLSGRAKRNLAGECWRWKIIPPQHPSANSPASQKNPCTSEPPTSVSDTFFFRVQAAATAPNVTKLLLCRFAQSQPYWQHDEMCAPVIKGKVSRSKVLYKL